MGIGLPVHVFLELLTHFVLLVATRHACLLCLCCRLRPVHDVSYPVGKCYATQGGRRGIASSVMANDMPCHPAQGYQRAGTLGIHQCRLTQHRGELCGASHQLYSPSAQVSTIYDGVLLHCHHISQDAVLVSSTCRLMAITSLCTSRSLQGDTCAG